MKFCPNNKCAYYLEQGIVAEFDNKLVKCLHCGAQLVSDQPTFKSEEELVQPDPAGDMVVIKNHFLSIEAEMLRKRLEAAGIPAFVTDSNVTSFYILTTFGGAQLMLHKSDLEIAAKILGQPLEAEDVI